MRDVTDPARVADAMDRAADTLEKIRLKYMPIRRGNDDDWTRAIKTLISGAEWHRALAAKQHNRSPDVTPEPLE